MQHDRDRSEIVLVVEDEDAIRNLICRALRRCGYTVREAAYPSEALRIALDREARLDLLLTDIVLPQMSGHELAELLVSERPAVPVVFMSGYATDALAAGRALGDARRILIKPFDQGELTRSVRQSLDDSRARTACAADEWK